MKKIAIFIDDSLAARKKIIQIINSIVDQFKFHRNKYNLSYYRIFSKRVFISSEKYLFLEDQIDELTNLLSQLTSDEVINISDWVKLVQETKSILAKINHRRLFHLQFYSIEYSHLLNYYDDLYYKIYDANYQIEKNSIPFIQERENIPLKLRLEEDLELYNVFVDRDNKKYDLIGKRDYLLFSTPIYMDEIVVIGLSEKAYKILKKSKTAHYSFWDLEESISELDNDDLFTEQLDIICYGNGIKEIKFNTKYLDPITIKFDTIQKVKNPQELGSYIAKRLSNSKFKHFALYHHYAQETYFDDLFLTDYRLTKEDIDEKFKFYSWSSTYTGYNGGEFENHAVTAAGFSRQKRNLEFHDGLNGGSDFIGYYTIDELKEIDLDDIIYNFDA